MSTINDVKISRLSPGDETEVTKLVYGCLDNVISEYYSDKVITFLKHLYTPERVLRSPNGPNSDNRETYLARVNDELTWSCSYEQRGNEIEIGMFYGKPTLKGVIGARSLINKLEDDLIEREASILAGNVLIPARPFFYKMGKRNGIIHFSEPFFVSDTDPETGENILIDVLRYTYTYDKLLVANQKKRFQKSGVNQVI